MANFNSYIESATRVTSPQSVDQSIGSALSSQINSLRRSISSGSIIRASHFRELRNAIETLRNHTHSYVDYDNANIFKEGRDSLQTKTTGVSSASSTSQLNDFVLNTGNTITANHYNTLARAANGLRNHTHSYTDYYVEPTQ